LYVELDMFNIKNCLNNNFFCRTNEFCYIIKKYQLKQKFTYKNISVNQAPEMEVDTAS